MVSTRQASKSRQPAEEDFCPTGGEDEYEEQSQEPKTRGTKRVRTTKTTAKDKAAERRNKKAKLSILPGMPIDILYEVRDFLCRFTSSLMRTGSQVFSLVHPKDLLHISWTAKILNGFLTCKSSRHVWQASFKGIPEGERPPPCPSVITEMAYANLVYGRFCTVRVLAFVVLSITLICYYRTVPTIVRQSQPGVP